MRDITFNRDRTRAAIELRHPKGNIITAETATSLVQTLEALGEHPHLKLVTLTGAGGDFSFGASVPEHAPAEIDRVLPLMHRLIYALLDAPAITAAVVRGRCLGGGFEIALACDFIFAADGALLGLPEIALGVFPPAASVLLPLKVGAARASRAILTGAAGPASDWHTAGLLEFVVPVDALSAELDRWFDLHLAPKSATALRHAAAAARVALKTRVRELLPELERLYLNDLMKTADAAEGIAAFLEKRSPKWTDC